MRVIIGNTRTPANPLLRAVYIVLGTIAFIAAFVFGAVILAVAIGAVVVLGAIGMARMWWLGRKLTGQAQSAAGDARAQQGAQTQRRSADGGRLIEGEFVDVSDRQDSERD